MLECLAPAPYPCIRDNPSTEFQHKAFLWIDGWYNTSWLREEVGGTGLLPLKKSAEGAGRGGGGEEEESDIKENSVHRKKKICNRSHERRVSFNGHDQHLQQQQNTTWPRTVVALLKACADQKDLYRGIRLHANIARTGLLQENVFIGCALVSMYAKCGSLAKAQEVCDKLPLRDVAAWNALIAGYVQHGQCEQALRCYKKMQNEGLSPDAVTFSCILKACASLEATAKGQEIHAEVAKEGLVEKNVVVGTALVDMYAKCGLLQKAQEVFDKLPVRNVVSWSALITGYTQHEHSRQALECYERMQLEGLSPNTVTYASALKACSNIGAADKGHEIHGAIVREGLLEKDIMSGNALIDMYAKCGLLAKAQEVCDKLPFRDVVSWNALMAGYAQQGHAEQALVCLGRMQLEGLSPDAITFATALKACGSIGAIDKGQEIHTKILGEGLLEKDIVLATALVDMYAKCGLLAKAQEVFDNLPIRSVVSWSALMEGYALLGKADHIFSSFDKMIGEGIKPNLIIFTIVLNACSHAGLLEKGQMYFQTMKTSYGIVPTLEIHTCMVALFARAGHLDKAVAVIEEMAFSADLTMWHTVLSACQKWGNVKIGRLAFDHILQLDKKSAAAYVCMSNIYANAGRQEDSDKVEVMRVKIASQP